MLLYGLAAILVLFTVLWVVSLRLENSSIVDVAWGPGILAIGLTYYLTGPSFYFASADGFVLRPHLTLALVALWAFRLASHLYARMRLLGEDFRYVGWRDRYEGHWWWISFFKVFLLQGFLAWVVSLPLYFAVVSMAPRALTFFDYLGILLFVAGLGIESVADEHLRRFRANRANKGKVLDKGLWKYSRHPNYFGESLVWWGFGLICLATGGLPGLLGPLVMTYLLIYVSGVALLESTLIEKAGYIQYVGRTPAFLPLPSSVQAQLMAKVKSLHTKPPPTPVKRRW